MRITIIKSLLIVAFAALLMQTTSCKKNQFITTTGAGLEFSLDTLTFDTVFTALGNATRRFKVYNPHTQIIRINRIYLGGGSQSDFHINIDGLSGTSSSNIEIPAGDSIYIFASVYIDPSNGDAIRLDSILFETDGGGTQAVILHAYGWNANYIGEVGRDTPFDNITTTFNDPRPYIIMGTLWFRNNACLIIPPGTQIFMFGGPTNRPGDRAMIYIGNESCIQSGVGGDFATNPVEIKTHRLEEDYQSIPFHHNGIRLSAGSINNLIHNTIIRNAVDGVFVDSLSTNGNPKLDMENCKIYNVERSGVLGRGTQIKMTNTVIANSNQYNFIGVYGGQYDFRHCTFANVGTGLVSRNEPILSYRNYEVRVVNGSEQVFTNPGAAYFTNCIFYGSRSEEIEVLTFGNPIDFQYQFTNCLMKVDTFGQGQAQNLVNCISNQDPLFLDEGNYDYQIDSDQSPANDAGISTAVNGLSGPIEDILGNQRSAINPAIGAYRILN